MKQDKPAKVDNEGYITLPARVFIQGPYLIAQVSGIVDFGDQFVMAADFETMVKIDMKIAKGESAVVDFG